MQPYQWLSRSNAVKFIETLKLAVAAIWAHKLRSALTLLGMIVGVTAFVVVVSLIEGFNRYVDEKIAGIGAKSFTIQRFNPLEDFFVSGATANCVDIENRDVAEGRFIAEPENEGAARVAYVGADVANKLFPAGNAVGQEISIRGLPYRVIGVETARGTVFGIPQDTFIILPLKTYATTYGSLIRQRSLYFIGTSK